MSRKRAERSQYGAFPAILKRERALRGWSQADVAGRIGSDPKTVGRWERGLTTPSLYLCQRLCELYGKTIQELGLLSTDTDQQTLSEDPPDSTHDGRAEQDEASVLPFPISELPPVTPEQTFVAPTKRKRLTKPRLLLLALLIVVILASAGGRWWYLLSTNTLANVYLGQQTLTLNNSLQTNTTADWSLDSNDEGSCFFTDHTYHVRVIKPGGYMKYCLAAGTYFTNFTFEAKMQVLVGDCGGLGFRTTFPQLYYFVICQDGNYRFVRYNKDQEADRRTMVQGVSSLIKRGLKTTNVLAVVAMDDTFKLYVNQRLLYQGTDDAYMDGQIGLLAHSCRITYADQRPDLCAVPDEVTFSDARIWT